MDLADPTERLQVAGQFRPPHRDADAVAALAERADHMAAEETGAAVNGDQGVDIGLGNGDLLVHRGACGRKWWGPSRREYRIGAVLYRPLSPI